MRISRPGLIQWLAYLVIAALPLWSAPASAVVPPEVIQKLDSLLNQKNYGEAQKLLQLEIDKGDEKDLVGLKISQADIWFHWGTELESQTLYDQAREKYQLAYAIDAQLRPNDAAIDLDCIGLTYKKQSDLDTAIAIYRQALQNLQGVEWNTQANLQYNLGNALKIRGRISDFPESRSALKKALDIYDQHPEEVSYNTERARILLTLGMVNHNLQKYADALENYDRARKYLKLPQDNVLLEIYWLQKANVYMAMGKEDKLAWSALQEAEALLKESPNQTNLFDSLETRGILLFRQRTPSSIASAEKAFDEALGILDQLQDKVGKASHLNNVAQGYELNGQNDKAFIYFDLAATAFEEIGNTYSQATVFENMGDNRMNARLYEDSRNYYRKALELQIRLRNKPKQATCLSGLMLLYLVQGDFDTAIAYGKASINVTRSVRGDTPLSDESTLSWRNYFNRETYEGLAAVLSIQNRNEEAEQVVRALRQGDNLVFLDREGALAKEFDQLLLPLSYTAREAALLPAELPKTIVSDFAPEASWKPVLADGHTALISTFNTNEELYVTLTTSKGRRMFRYPIKRDQFKVLCDKLQEKLASRLSRPASDAKKLYDIVFCGGALKTELEKAKVQRVLWFRTGALRSIPIDALHDGTSYLIQKPWLNMYATFNPQVYARMPRLDHIVAAGVSVKSTIASPTAREPRKYGSLPNVSRELKAIVQEPVQAALGPIPGRIFLNKDFTESNLQTALPKADILHLATHFDLASETDLQPVLVLGKGQALTPKAWEKLKFDNLSLLTLSACDTGRGGSIGELSEWLGARSIIASQWPVEDISTAQLMSDFYRLWKKNPRAGKAVALRQAQVNLLSGQSSASIGIVRGKPEMAGSQPPIKGEEYAHPFFWAPFELTGNWR